MTDSGAAPLVSVLVTTHERADQCLRAVRSALAQTLPPLEVLVWDDGSSATTRERLREVAALDERVAIHESETWAGTPAAGRNRLVALARGDWLAFLDDDDEWLPDKLERQRPSLDAWDVVGSAVRRRSNGTVYAPHTGSVSRSAVYRDNPLVLSTALVRAKLPAIRFREDRALAGVEDYCLWLDLADAGARIVTTSDVVAVYDDAGADRLSDAAGLQRRLARHMLGRWRARPGDRDAAAGAVVHASRAAKLRAREVLGR